MCCVWGVMAEQQQQQQASQNNRPPPLNMSATTPGKDLFGAAGGRCEGREMGVSAVVRTVGVSQWCLGDGTDLSCSISADFGQTFQGRATYSTCTNLCFNYQSVISTFQQSLVF